MRRTEDERLLEALDFIDEVYVGELEKYYRKAKEVLALNREFLEKVAEALANKGYLVMADIKEIKQSCKITPVAL